MPYPEVGPGHAVSRDLAEDDAWVHLAHLLEADAAALQCPRPHRLDHGVCAAHELEVGGDALGLAQVDHDAALAAVQVPVEQRDAVDDRERHLTDVVAAGVLDLDHLGAEIGELHPHSCWAEQRALDDSHPGEQPLVLLRIRHRLLPFERHSPRAIGYRCRGALATLRLGAVADASAHA